MDRAHRGGGAVRAAGRVARAVDAVLVLLMALVVVNVAWQVVSRYGLGRPSSFTDELSRFLLVWIGLLGAARGVGRREHLSMNVLAARLSGVRREWLGIAVDLAVAAFALLVLVGGGGGLMALSFGLGQRSAALGVPLGLVYLVLPVSGLLIAGYAFGFVAHRVRRLRSGGVAG